ncbi:MAG: DNA polymerase/3'-5' exonuclease PolX [Gemmatimonadota bacterium]|nr:DNA polymerase/3'-5' exonuclease PolX [Gemmatimonadota bacterium]
MDSRSAAHILSQIGTLLDLRGAPRFNSRAYQRASRAVLALGVDDLTPLYKSGELKKTKGIGPATLSVIQELIETGESSYLNRLREETPGGLFDLLRVPGLGGTKISLVHEQLGVETLDDLEAAALDGRLAKLKGFGPRTAERLLKRIEFARHATRRTLYHRGLLQAEILRTTVEKHPDVIEAIVAGSVRRHNETIGDIDIVAVCSAEPASVAESFAGMPGVRHSELKGDTVSIRFVDDVSTDIACTTAANAGFVLWQLTGSDAHVTQMKEWATSRKLGITDTALSSPRGKAQMCATEKDFFSALGLTEIPPELREGRGEIGASAAGSLPQLLAWEDIRGVLHCHTTYSDGDGTIDEMAEAARERGWSYLGVSDHSESAFYAGGLKRDKLKRQHDEIDEINSRTKEFRVLKGIEADILADGRVDYSDETLDTFDYVIGSVHSRFSMDGAAMTDRVLKAMDDPRLTILGHPTGRLLLTREPYAIDIEAVIQKAADTGTVIELNCDPHRLDMDWRHCRTAKEMGVPIEIGPDAHSERGLDNVDIGVGMGRKAWLSANDVFNTRSADEIVAFAREKRSR